MVRSLNKQEIALAGLVSISLLAVSLGSVALKSEQTRLNKQLARLTLWLKAGFLVSLISLVCMVVYLAIS